MVYYGKLSKGCQRCRQRKIKCDQRKPECFNCEKSSRQCPGYRDLNEVLFRDDTQRIIRNRRRKEHSKSSIPSYSYTASGLYLHLNLQDVSTSLSPLATDLGATFFFTKYLPRETVISRNFHNWLIESYFSPEGSYTLKAIIHAVGIAGISIISPARHFELECQKWHCRALSSLKNVLNDSIQAISDATLTTVILLAFYEMITSHAQNKKDPLIHIEGAIALLQSRNQDQFTHERGAHLLGQVTSRMLPMCLQEGRSVPPALAQATYTYRSSARRQEWYRQKTSHHGSLTEIAFRLVNLHASIRSASLTDHVVIKHLALEIDRDLVFWGDGVPGTYRFSILDRNGDCGGSDRDRGGGCGCGCECECDCFGGCLERRYHVYPNQRIAEIRNSWRIQRIALHRILRFNGCQSESGSGDSSSLEIIGRFSLDICLSVGYIMGSPRSIALLGPLYIIAVEDVNPSHLRVFAINQLRRMCRSMGVRRAGLLAEQASRLHIAEGADEKRAICAFW